MPSAGRVVVEIDIVAVEPIDSVPVGLEVEARVGWVLDVSDSLDLEATVGSPRLILGLNAECEMFLRVAIIQPDLHMVAAIFIHLDPAGGAFEIFIDVIPQPVEVAVLVGLFVLENKRHFRVSTERPRSFASG